MPRLTPEELADLRAQEKVRAEQFEKDQQAKLTDAGIPEEFHAFIRSNAWDHGHSSGYGEVLGYVDDLIYNLKPAIEAFQKRVTAGS